MADQFVGIIALTLGGVGLAASATPTTWPLRWSLARSIQQRGGNSALRVFFIVGGLTMFAIGISLLI